MKKPTHHKVNLRFEVETLEVIDAFAQATGRTRTYVIESLLKPSLPALRKFTNEQQNSVYDQWAAESDLEASLNRPPLD